jgi:hypothetical protein
MYCLSVRFYKEFSICFHNHALIERHSVTLSVSAGDILNADMVFRKAISSALFALCSAL